MCVRCGISADVELGQCRASLVEGPLAQHEAVAVVVHVREADPVAAVAKDPQLAGGGRLQHVRQEEGVARTVHLVRRDGHSEQIIATGVREEFLASGLCGCVLLEVAALWDGRHLGLDQPLDVAPVEARARRRGHHDLRHAGVAAGLQHMAGAADVDVLVQLRRVERPHGSTQVPHAVGPRHGLGHRLEGAQVALHILYAWILPRVRRRWEDVEGHDALRPTLHKHLHEPLADEATSACDHAVGRHWGVLHLRGATLQRRERRGCRHGGNLQH
mmetsp:Transcript_24527/g.70472  ORF Transcript_24527/g.70472 Transcript_24527/m.70472 type:complete len:273 (+) Transcript_24527:484-1302(+)